jgi:hypothetical protein
VLADGETWDNILQEIEKERDSKIAAVQIFSYGDRINQRMPGDPEIGPTPAYLIPHSIGHYRCSSEPHDIATTRLNGDTPSERSFDITGLPGWIESVASFCDQETDIFKPEELNDARGFKKLLDNMLSTVFTLLETRNEIRVALGLEPVKIMRRPDQNPVDQERHVLEKR